MVFSRILISKNSDTLATYHTSYSNFCSQLMALRPLICAHPVMPGELHACVTIVRCKGGGILAAADGADQAHVAFQNVEKLRYFNHRGGADKSANLYKPVFVW